MPKEKQMDFYDLQEPDDIIPLEKIATFKDGFFTGRFLGKIFRGEYEVYLFQVQGDPNVIGIWGCFALERLNQLVPYCDDREIMVKLVYKGKMDLDNGRTLHKAKLSFDLESKNLLESLEKETRELFKNESKKD